MAYKPNPAITRADVTRAKAEKREAKAAKQAAKGGGEEGGDGRR